MISNLTLVIRGRPSPWANQPQEGVWRSQIADQVRETVPEPFSKEIRPRKVRIEFLMIQSRRGDLDNLAKPVLDTLFRQSRKSAHPVACIFMCDDCHIEELTLKRTIVTDPADEGAIVSIEFD